MTGISGLAACVLGNLMFTLAPVPKEPAPDPLGRGAIGIQADVDSMTITEIYKNMPAEKAGLQRGDRILRVGSLRPQTFAEVVAHISSYRPGAQVEVEVQRGTDTLTLQVVITARPSEFDRQ
jgi:S1-C subfamily serine protease